MPYTGPGYQNMISYNTPDEARAHLASCLRTFKATEDVCWITDMQDTMSWEKPQLNCRFRLNYNSYLGWKVAGLMSGAFVYDSAYENELVKVGE